MEERIQKRVVELAEIIIKTGCTVRSAAVIAGVSKSTVHKDLVERLPRLSKVRYEEVKKILEKNKAERHIRGGEATRRKYYKNR